MAKQITYIDFDRADIESNLLDKQIEEQLKNYKIINIETLEEVIRFWYNEEE